MPGERLRRDCDRTSLRGSPCPFSRTSCEIRLWAVAILNDRRLWADGFRRLSRQSRRPLPRDASQLDVHVLLALPRPLQDLEPMVRGLQRVERRPLTEPLADGSQELHLGQFVT